MKCTSCGGATKKTTTSHEMRIGKHLVRGTVPANECTKCKDSYPSGEALERIELQVAAEVARSGQVSGDTFRFMRTALGLKAKELSEVIGTPAETISRWEKGAREVDRFAWTVIASMTVDRAEGREPVTEQMLGAIRKPSALPRTAKVV